MERRWTKADMGASAAMRLFGQLVLMPSVGWQGPLTLADMLSNGLHAREMATYYTRLGAHRIPRYHYAARRVAVCKAREARLESLYYGFRLPGSAC
jgi:hypothetical protein